MFARAALQDALRLANVDFGCGVTKENSRCCLSLIDSGCRIMQARIIHDIEAVYWLERDLKDVLGARALEALAAFIRGTCVVIFIRSDVGVAQSRLYLYGVTEHGAESV